jgi:hypothetical protein
LRISITVFILWPENPLAALGVSGGDPVSQYAAFMTNMADVQVDYEHISGLVRAMRGTLEESKDKQLFDYLVTLTLDTYKYRIPDADKKTPLRRAFARRFQKVREIEGLHRQMLACRQRADEVMS